MLTKTKKKIVKIQNLKISKIRKSNFVRILETKIQEKFQKIQDRFVGGVAFCNFGSHRFYVNENEKQIGKI